jgi:spermidine synthase
MMSEQVRHPHGTATASVLRVLMLEFEVIDHVESSVGVIILSRRLAPVEGVIELSLEHQLLMSSAVTVSECELATRAVQMHGGTNLDVMIGGLGLGYTSKAALDTGRVARVEVVELVGGVISWFQRGIIPLGAELSNDPRFRATEDDVFARLRRAPSVKHDLLLIDVDHSPDHRLGDPSDGFYSQADLALAAKHLEPDGVFGLWSTSESPLFEAELRKSFDEVRIDAIDFFNETTNSPETNWLFLARGPIHARISTAAVEVPRRGDDPAL